MWTRKGFDSQAVLRRIALGIGMTLALSGFGSTALAVSDSDAAVERTDRVEWLYSALPDDPAMGPYADPHGGAT